MYSFFCSCLRANCRPRFKCIVLVDASNYLVSNYFLPKRILPSSALLISLLDALRLENIMFILYILVRYSMRICFIFIFIDLNFKPPFLMFSHCSLFLLIFICIRNIFCIIFFTFYESSQIYISLFQRILSFVSEDNIFNCQTTF